MNWQDRLKRSAITAAIGLGLFSGLLVFIATCARIPKAWYQIPLGLLAGLAYFGVAFAGVIGIFKIIRWMILGFYLDKETGEETCDNLRNPREGCRRIVIGLTVIVAAGCALYGGFIPLNEHRIAQNDFRIAQSQSEYDGKAYHDYTGRMRAPDSFWLRLPKGQLVALCIIGATWGGAIGAALTWLGYRFLERLILNFYGYTEH
jgi:hypothetical protein